MIRCHVFIFERSKVFQYSLKSVLIVHKYYYEDSSVTQDDSFRSYKYKIFREVCFTTFYVQNVYLFSCVLVPVS